HEGSLTTTRRLESGGSAVFAALAAMLLVCDPAVPQEAVRTTTPAPRLSGGFGRPRATPAVKTPYDGGQTFTDVVHAAHESRDAAPADGGTVTINNRSLVKDSTKGKVSSSKAAPHAGKPAPTSAPAAIATTPVPAPVADAAAAGGGEAQ